MKRLFLIMFLSLWVGGAQGQEGSSASQKLENAINLMDNGFPDEAIKILAEAKSLDKKNYVYDFETGYAYYIKKDYKKALEYFKETLKYKENSDQCYQMTGNFYDMNGDPVQALVIYDKGLEKFPHSGRLYLEKGNVCWGQKKYLEALSDYEKGIQADPGFPSNYYRATLIYCNSMNPLWGLIYGEIFLNLEQDTPRSVEISKLIFNTYREHIIFSGDTVRTSFSNNPQIVVQNPRDMGSVRLPYGSNIYEPILLLSVNDCKEINLFTLDSIRTRFIINYYRQDFSKRYSNILFEYQQKLIDNGYGSAYNYWVLRGGDDQTFLKWKEEHQEIWSNFLQWITANPLQVGGTHVLTRMQFE